MSGDIEITGDVNIVVRFHESYLRRIAKKLKWDLDTLVAELSCKKVSDELYECFAVKVEDNKTVVNPYLLGVLEKMKNSMYKAV